LPASAAGEGSAFKNELKNDIGLSGKSTQPKQGEIKKLEKGISSTPQTPARSSAANNSGDMKNRFHPEYHSAAKDARVSEISKWSSIFFEMDGRGGSRGGSHRLQRRPISSLRLATIAHRMRPATQCPVESVQIKENGRRKKTSNAILVVHLDREAGMYDGLRAFIWMRGLCSLRQPEAGIRVGVGA
jgi:hypothetical protein